MKKAFMSITFFFLPVVTRQHENKVKQKPPENAFSLYQVWNWKAFVSCLQVTGITKCLNVEVFMQYPPIFGSGKARGKASGRASDCIANSAARGMVVETWITISEKVPNVLQSHQSYQSRVWVLNKSKFLWCKMIKITGFH